MLYFFLVPLKKYFFLFNVFRYITVRTALAGITALLISLLFAPWLIRILKERQIGQEIRLEGPQSHYGKKGTPSMGGILIIASTIIPTLLWANLGNIHVWIGMATMLLFGAIGYWDDYLKVSKKRSLGLTIRGKLLLQIGLSLAFGLVLVYLGMKGQGIKGEFNLQLNFPFIKQWIPYLGLFYLPWIMFLLVSSSNAVNFTDGLDGLAIGLMLISSAALTALAYLVGNFNWSGYLQIAFVRTAAELTIFAGSLTGACLGFLWFNCHPAQMFMGDVGALSLGGSLAIIAIMIKQEFLLFFIAGVFILEALSVLIQIVYFRISGGKRVFKMAPLHHHFELAGWPEEKVVIRFWILAIVFALFSLATLKLR